MDEVDEVGVKGVDDKEQMEWIKNGESVKMID